MVPEPCSGAGYVVTTYTVSHAIHAHESCVHVAARIVHSSSLVPRPLPIFQCCMHWGRGYTPVHSFFFHQLLVLPLCIQLLCKMPRVPLHQLLSQGLCLPVAPPIAQASGYLSACSLANYCSGCFPTSRSVLRAPLSR